jgi:hypothetical protein
MIALVILSALDKADVWPYAERYLGVGTRSYSRFAPDLDVDDAYHPQRGPATFELPTFWITDGAGEYLTNSIGSALHRLYREDGRFLLPVHPQTLDSLPVDEGEALRRCEPGPRLTAIPSANVRTVFVTELDGEPVTRHFVKLHYPRRLSRFTRRLRRPIIGVQLWVAAELHRAGLPVLPEVGAGVFGHNPTEAWGFLIREQTPDLVAPAECTVPLFALYGDDLRGPGEETLLEQLIVRNGGSATSFVVDRVVRPIVALWLRAATQLGCALEMHGQNTLFGFSQDATTTTVMYRDCGVYVDPAVRAQRGLPAGLPPINVIGRDVVWPREQVFSLAYDSFTGHHALDYLDRLGRTTLGIREGVLPAAARDEFARCAEATGLLPATVSYYDGELHPDGGWELVDTGAPPTWR